MKSCIFSVLNVPWMVLNDLTSQHIPVDMGVDFSGRNRLVSQHTLDGAEVGTSFQQVGGEGMAEGVRTDIFGDAGFLCQLFNQVKNHDAGNAISPSGKKNVIFKSFLYLPRLRSSSQYFISLMARGEIRTKRCLLPFPSTLIKPSSK